jgi:hypothetical protein
MTKDFPLTRRNCQTQKCVKDKADISRNRPTSLLHLGTFCTRLAATARTEIRVSDA